MDRGREIELMRIGKNYRILRPKYNCNSVSAQLFLAPIELLDLQHAVYRKTFLKVFYILFKYNLFQSLSLFLEKYISTKGFTNIVNHSTKLRYKMITRCFEILRTFVMSEALLNTYTYTDLEYKMMEFCIRSRMMHQRMCFLSLFLQPCFLCGCFLCACRSINCLKSSSLCS